MSNESIEQLKAAEKEALKAFEQADKADMTDIDKKRGGFDPRYLRLGLLLIILGGLALAAIVADVNLWRFWWVIFFIKPLLFGWGRQGWGFGQTCGRNDTN